MLQDGQNNLITYPDFSNKKWMTQRETRVKVNKFSQMEFVGKHIITYKH